MKAYKASYNHICNNTIFTEGFTYEMKGKPELCSEGFHACGNPDDVFGYYPYNENFVLFEVEILGDFVESYDKVCTNKMKIVRVIPFEEYNDIFVNHKFDEYGNLIYKEESNGYWEKFEYDDYGNLIYLEDSYGFWEKSKFDEFGNEIYWENSNNFWKKSKFDEFGNLIYLEDSNGTKKETEYLVY